MMANENARLSAAHCAERTQERRRVLIRIAASAFLLATCLTIFSVASAAKPGQRPKDLTIVAAIQALPIVIDGWCVNPAATRLRCQVRAEKPKQVSLDDEESYYLMPKQVLSGEESYYLMVFTADGREIETISTYPVGEQRIIYRLEPK